jgi:cation transport regulator ChaB
MTTMNEELLLDADGIPILTELVHEDAPPAEVDHYQDNGIAGAPPAEIADRLLNSKYFHQQVAEITAALTQDVRHQVEQTLQPAIEQAIIWALEDSDTHAAETVRQQLEAALPDLIAQALEE